MPSQDFSSWATLQLPPSSRLFPSACCPDKDLVVVVSRLGSKDQISLWKMQGSKKWDVVVDTGNPHPEEVVDITWSSDGQTIVLIHDPPRITLHSVQDGAEQRAISLQNVVKDGFRLAHVWWFTEQKKRKESIIPDIFKRGDIITGSSHSVLKLLPLLDPVKDLTQALSANDLFAFQTTQPKSPAKTSLPQSIATWPTLPPDPLAASIQPSARTSEQDPQDEIDEGESDDTKPNSLLVVSDDDGQVHIFLQGCYPLGSFLVADKSTTTSLLKSSNCSTMFAHQLRDINGINATSSVPSTVRLPLLDKRMPMDVAKASTVARELLWYIIRVVDEMRTAWQGSNTQTSARDQGPKWLRSLEALQDNKLGDHKSAWSIVDLMMYLVTGRPSDAVSDFIGSGEQMSERGLLKWESTVVEALIKLRDYSEQRVAPACQRLHIVLEDLLGWSQLSALYGPCDLDTEEIKKCVEDAGRAIVAASWLSATARRELSRFKEFMRWLRYEITVASSPDDVPHVAPTHDILEVNDYLLTGLHRSQIDRWFDGGAAKFSPQDLGVPDEKQDLATVMKRARLALRDRTSTDLYHHVTERNLFPLDRNVDALVRDLAGRCQTIFLRAAGATGRSANVLQAPNSANRVSNPDQDLLPKSGFVIRERSDQDKNRTSRFVQHLAIHAPSDTHGASLYLFRVKYDQEDPVSSIQSSVAVLECRIREEEDGGFADFSLLDVEFFDEESLVIIYRQGASGPTLLSTVGYSDITYQDLAGNMKPSREGMMLDAFSRWKSGQLESTPIPIKKSRTLAVCKEGPVSLAVNGRVGRRVVCVLDVDQSILEVLDLEGDDTEDETVEHEEEDAE